MVPISTPADVAPPAYRRDLTHQVGVVERGKLVLLPDRESKPRGEPMGVRAKEDGKSEGRFVMRRIGVALPGKITPRESGQTSIRSFLTRKPELPTLETKRMTAVETQAGAVPNERIDWTTIDWRTVNQNVRRLQAHIVKATQVHRQKLVVVKPRPEKGVGKA